MKATVILIAVVAGAILVITTVALRGSHSKQGAGDIRIDNPLAGTPAPPVVDTAVGIVEAPSIENTTQLETPPVSEERIPDPVPAEDLDRKYRFTSVAELEAKVLSLNSEMNRLGSIRANELFATGQYQSFIKPVDEGLKVDAEFPDGRPAFSATQGQLLPDGRIEHRLVQLDLAKEPTTAALDAEKQFIKTLLRSKKKK